VSSRRSEATVGIYYLGRVAGRKHPTVGPDTRSLRSLLRDDNCDQPAIRKGELGMTTPPHESRTTVRCAVALLGAILSLGCSNPTTPASELAGAVRGWNVQSGAHGKTGILSRPGDAHAILHTDGLWALAQPLCRVHDLECLLCL
jgi:hypothetical protein